jgi:ATP-dependent DNA helicase DinG
VTRPDGGGGDEADEEGETFRWYQTRRLRGGQAFSTLVRTPLAIDRTLQRVLFADTPRAIFTSATLASGGGFTFLKRRLGLMDDEPAADAPVEVIEGSPFDYARHCLLYIPRTLGAPSFGSFGNGGGGTDNDSYADRVADEVLALVEAARGRTFALFTSHRMLQAVRDRLWGRTDYPLFVQGEMPNARLVEAFAAAGDGVLLGTSSFWEGVDVPGPALSCVILDKLPFAAPDAPAQRAREDALRAEGGDAFRQLSLPQAQLRLKQGFGRLLRGPADRGVVCILDGRLWTKSYGREFLADLPPCPRTDRRDDVARFFAATDTPPNPAKISEVSSGQF